MSIWTRPPAALTLIGAHRGASSTATENGCGALLEAIAVGADFVEIDVRLTSDGAAVAFHDPDFRRVANDPRALHDVTLNTARQLWPDLLTINEAAEIAAGRIAVLLDVKEDAADAPARLGIELAGIIARGDVALGLRSLQAVQIFADFYPDCPRLGLFNDPADYPFLAARGGHWGRLWHADISDAALNTLRAAGLRVIVMVGIPTPQGVGEIDDPDLAALLSCRPDAIMLNDPARALRLRSAALLPGQ